MTRRPSETLRDGCSVTGEPSTVPAPAALTSYRDARATGLFDALEGGGLFVPSELLSSATAGLDPDVVGEWVVRQKELPLVSYVYEWSFSMVRDAALATLRSLEAASTRASS